MSTRKAPAPPGMTFSRAHSSTKLARAILAAPRCRQKCAIADSWLSALPILSNNWEHTDFNFQTMTTVTGSWIEPDMAIGIAWLEYMAYAQFHDAKYLTGADLCMTQMN